MRGNQTLDPGFRFFLPGFVCGPRNDKGRSLDYLVRANPGRGPLEPVNRLCPLLAGFLPYLGRHTEIRGRII